jgi:D-amino-acid dehydrogenase
MNNTTDVVVIGGGVIGVCTAYFLAKGGRSVSIIEKGEICSGCSYGNACLITPSHSIPLPGPGVIRQALKWLLWEDSPFLIRPRLDFGLFSWMIRFAMACRKGPLNAAIPVLRDLTRSSLKLFEELIDDEQLSFNLDRRGLMSVYTTEAGFEKGRREAALLTKHGFDSKILDGRQARALEPALVESIAGVVYHAEDAHGDSYRFVQQMAGALRKFEIQIHTQTNAIGWVGDGKGPIRIQTDKGEFIGRDIVIATGAWAPNLVLKLGWRIPIQPGKGYSVTMDCPPVCPVVPLMNMERRVAITPIGQRLRFAGTMEFAGYDLSLKQRRVDSVRRAGEKIIPEIENPKNVERWCGLRACTPDGLPIIDRMPHHKNIYVSTGHALLGYTLGPISGKILSELIIHGRSSTPAKALALDRF